MPKQSYALEPGGPKRLQVSWKSFFKDTVITLDGVVVGSIPDQPTLREGQDFRLMDGSIIKVQLISNLSGTEMRVLRNGVPLPGSASNPETRVKTATGIIFFVAGLNLLLGLIALITQSDFLAQIGIGWYSLVFGGFFLVMGFLVRKLSTVALILSIVVFALDGLIGLIGSLMMGGTPFAGVIFRVLLIIPMVQAVSAIKELKNPSLPPIVPPSMPPAM
jgi:hypothetical protein